MTPNRQWLIDGQPRGRALLESDFKQQTVELEPLEAGRARIKVEILGFDPSMKGQMENIGYAAATSRGDVMLGSGIGEGHPAPIGARLHPSATGSTGRVPHADPVEGRASAAGRLRGAARRARSHDEARQILAGPRGLHAGSAQ